MAKSKFSILTPEAIKLVALIMVVGVVGILLGLNFATSTSDQESQLVNHNSYQAVQLTDGTVFYGQIRLITDSYLVLDNAYYENNADADDKKVSLTRHGTEPYQPDGSVKLNRTQILFWENLQQDSVVTKTIQASTD